jgi:HAD superfamily hydrolase (TIGR01509 family)
MPIKAILFDLDGTLIDSTHFHYRLVTEILAKPISRETFDDCFLGTHATTAFPKLCEVAGIPYSSNFIQKYYEKKKYVLKHKRPKELFKLQLDVRKMLLDVHQVYKIAVVTSSSRHFVEEVLYDFGIQAFFDVIISGDTHIGKPDPKPYLLACERLGYKPQECIIVEDAKSGIAAAKAAGIHCISISKNKADYNSTIAQLPILIARISAGVA